MESDIYESLIMEALSNDAKNIKLVSKTNNIVYKAENSRYGTVYIKFYLNKSSHIDNEMNLYGLIDSKYLKEVIVSSKNPKFAVFKELKGKTIDELDSKDLKDNSEQIINSVIYFYDTLGKEKTKGYGLLDENMCGTSTDFQNFLIKRQTDTQNILKDYPVLNCAFSKIFDIYKDLLVGDNVLVPIDTNAKNIMITESGDVKFIDPGELISAPKLMGYGDFVAHIYKTELYDMLMKKLNLSEDDEKRLRIYAIFSSLNVLAFLKNLGVTDLKNVIPYGNKYSFYSLIEEHLEILGIDK